MSNAESPAPEKPPAPAIVPFTSYQKFIVAILAFLQFTIILDFMIISPLGARLMSELKVSASNFGLLVSVYAFSAGLSGLMAAGFADRFDRKRLLLFFYSGFVLGTLLCGIAPNYHFLLVARVVTGLFGGVIGSVSLAIVADLFPLQMRGRVMGVVQTAFAASQVLGIPLGLILSDAWGWHMPFLLIVAVSAAVGIVILLRMQPIVGHLKLQRHENPLRHLLRTATRPEYVKAYASTTLLVTGGFMLMPFGSAFTVHNLGIDINRLKFIYMVTGLSSIVAGPLLGRLSDRLGKYALFCAGSAITIVMVAIYTHLGVTPIGVVMAVNVLLFVGVTCRMISASALISGVPDAATRGAFMSVNASVQQFSGGIASAVGGLIVVETAGGQLRHYDILGYVVMTSMVIAMVMLYPIHKAVMAKMAGAAAAAPMSSGSVAAPTANGGATAAQSAQVASTASTSSAPSADA